MNKKPIELPENELLVWGQVATLGNWPGMQDGKPVTQVCDEVAFQRLVDVFEPELLVDFEHRSVNSDDTTAAAWAQALRWTPEDGLECHIRCTDIGAADIRNRRRRYLSPVWRLDREGRPIKLKSIGLTNDPNFDLKPVLNKAGADKADEQSGASTVDTPPRKERKMNKLAALYGLPETATEAEIMAAAQAAKDEIDALKKRLEELDAKALEAEAEGVATENKALIANKDGFKKLYCQNKAIAMDFLGCVARPAADAPVCNKKDASLPSFATTQKDEGACQNKFRQWSAMPEGPAKDKFLDDNAAAINDEAPQA
jgi:hypothetical protein